MTTQIALIETVPATVAVEATAAPVAAKPKRTRKAPTPVIETPAVAVEAKPATKAKAAPKAKAEPKAKAASKPKAKAAAKVAAAPAPVLAFKITTGGKPSAGARLFAHTQAVHDLTGMSKGAKVGRATLRSILGDTAIAYHLKQGNYKLTDNSMVYISELGFATFELRAGKILPSDYAAFVDILTTGKPNDLCKNPIFIEAI